MSKQTILAFSQQYTRKGSLKIDDFCNEKAANNKVIENSIRNISLSQQVTNQSKPKDIYNYELEVAYDNNLSKIREEKIEEMIISTERKKESQVKETDFIFSNSQLENICKGNLNVQESENFLAENSEKEFSLNEKDYEEMIFASQVKDKFSHNLKENLLNSNKKMNQKLTLLTGKKESDKLNTKLDSNCNQLSKCKIKPQITNKSNKKKSLDLGKSNLNTKLSSNEIEFSSQDLSEIILVDDFKVRELKEVNLNSKNIVLSKNQEEEKEDLLNLLKKYMISHENLAKKFEEKCLEINFLKQKIYNLEFENYKNILSQDKCIKEKFDYSIQDKTPVIGSVKLSKDNLLFQHNKLQENSIKNNVKTVTTKSTEITYKNHIELKPVLKCINKGNKGKSISNLANSETNTNLFNHVSEKTPDNRKGLNASHIDLKDDDFDNMMKNLKENKEVKCSLQLTTAKKYNFNEDQQTFSDELPKFKNIEENSFKDEFNESDLLIEEEEKVTKLPPAFFCGINKKRVNQNNSKDNSRLNKLLEEMERDVIVDNLIDEIPKENNNKKESFSKHFEIETLNKLGKGTMSQALAKNIIISNNQEKYDILIKDNPLKINYQNADKYRFLCPCTTLYPIVSCEICNKKKFIDIFNFENIIKTIAKKNKIKIDFKCTDIKHWINYHYKLSVWKYFSISKLSSEFLSIDKVANDVLKKYNIIHNQGKRSFLMKVAEKDALINRNIVLLVVNITKKDAIFKENSKIVKKLYYVLELTDGYKSVYCKIFPVNPIFHLIKNEQIVEGMKLNIGTCKIEGEINEGSIIYVQLQYNSVSRAENTEKLGACRTLYQIRSLFSLREDGGDISMIDIIVLKKFNYYFFDMTNKKRFSIEKYEKMQEKLNENENDNEKEAPKKHQDKKLLLNFKIIAVDSLHLYEFLNRSRKTNKFELKKSLEKSVRKCVIEFGNNIDLYSSISEGSRYKLMRISTNYQKSNTEDEKTESSFILSAETISNKKVLNLKAPIKGFQFIEMPLEMNKKDIMYNNFIKELNQKYMSKYEGQDIDIMEILAQKNIDFECLLNEEYNVVGVFIENLLINGQPHILVANYIKSLYLIKLHSGDFFDDSCMTTNKLILLTNGILKAIYFPNEKSFFSLFKKSPNFNQYNKLILSIETSNYSSVKNLPVNKFKNITKMLKNNVNSNDVYDEEMMKNLKKEL